MNGEIAKDKEYQRELFEKLRKSASLQREEACFGSCMQPNLWWLIETPHPSHAELKAMVHGSCAIAKKSPGKKGGHCIGSLAAAMKRAVKEKAVVKFECLHGTSGIIYPIIQGDKLYGYIGACYRKKDLPPYLLDIFAAFTDTIVKETQKELELSKLYETIRPRAIALSTVHTVHRLISSTLNLNELLPRVARLSLQIMRANRCSIKLIDSRRKILLPKATVDLRAKKTKLKKVRVGRWAPGKAVKFGRPIRGDRYLSVPLIDEDVIGVITVYDKVDGKPFSMFDQEIMATLAEQAVIAIKNAQLYKEQEKLTMGSIKSLAAMLDSRAPGSYVPRASFLRITMAVGQELHLDSAELKSLEYAALLHDAGQINVPQEVLSKPSKLSVEEYDMVKAHPVRSVEIIRHMKALKSVVPIILAHHENYDGSGYPRGLAKNQIPIGARIMAVVDAFEAMTTPRPYRPTKTTAEAIEEIRRHAGTQFDPHVVEAFLAALQRKDVQVLISNENPREVSHEAY